MNNFGTIEGCIGNLWYNKPVYPSTFGKCCELECENSARGSGVCFECTLEELAHKINDYELASEYADAVCLCQNLKGDILDRKGGEA